MSRRPNPVRVLVVEDSTTARALLVGLLAADPAIEVVGEAPTGADAVEATVRLRPSIIVMDIEMPVMDGLEATKRIMIDCPTPILIVTAAHDPGDVELSLRAVRVGALALIRKPVGPAAAGFDADARRLVSLVKALSEVKVVRRYDRRTPEASPPPGPTARQAPRPERVQAVAVAASTGGPAALYRFLEGLPRALAVPVLVVQHIAPGFLPGLVSWLGGATVLPVQEAADGERLSPGTVHIAPDATHLEVHAGRVTLSDAAPVGGFRPSANVLFRSLAREYGAACAAVVLTGMGTDGLDGAHAVHEAGGLVLAQDEQSSAVFGMPRAVVDAGLAHEVAAVEDLVLSLLRYVPMRAE